MPLGMATGDGKQAYRLVMVKSKNPPHKANLKDDYQRIQEVALETKQNKMLLEWVKTKRESTYIHFNESFDGCDILKQWVQGSSKNNIE
jgi:peptidyl-prolyl cis-trans isomerase SurA